MIKLAEIFQDNMVLQRRKPIHIWGESDVSQEVTIRLNDKMILQQQVGRSFSLLLPAQEAMECASLVISGSTGDSLEFHNVDIGEVWIAGGQSNMEFMLEYDREGEQVIAEADDRHYRFYDVGEYAFEGEREEQLKCMASHWDKWNAFEPENARYFSAVGTYFAKILRKELCVPVGIVGCNWGGSSASCWIPEEDLLNDPVLQVYMDEYEQELSKIENMEAYYQDDYELRKLAGSQEAKADLDIVMKNEAITPMGEGEKRQTELQDAVHRMGPHHEWRPSGLYHTMVTMIAGYSAAGVIWYQGCSDDHHADIYDRLMPTVIRRWRTDWKEELPFLFVQLAPFEEWRLSNGSNYPILRAKQQSVADNEPSCYMASIMDVGSRYDIHPKEKRAPGERLAGLALYYVYQTPGSDEMCESPRIGHIERNGTELIIYFRYAPYGLTLDETKCDFSGLSKLFRVWVDKKPTSFTASVQGNRVVLSAEEFLSSDDVEISFADMDYCVVNLRAVKAGGIGLPARPYARAAV